MGKVAFKVIQETNEEVVRDIKECAFFKNYPLDELNDLANVTEIVEFASNTKILIQGETSSNIFFLMKGIVGIYINGEKVSRMQRKGDLIGELNFASKRPSTSTVSCETKCQFLKFNVNEVKRIPGQAKEYFEQNLYKYYAIMLTEKLESANDKANQFELVIRQLQETQHALEETNQQLEQKIRHRTHELEQRNEVLLASEKRLEDLYNSRDMTFQKLGKLHKKYLRPFQKQLRKLSSDMPAELKKWPNELEKQIDIVIQELIPITAFYKSEKALKRKRLLLVETSKKTQNIVKMALGGVGIEIDYAQTYEDANEAIEKNEYDIICVGLELISISKIAHHKYPQCKIVLITSDDNTDYLNKIAEYDFITNIVSRNVKDRIFTVKNILVTISKLVNQDFFGVEKYLNWGANVQHFEVNDSEQRRQLIDEMVDYFTSLGVRSTILANLIIVAEELLMNIIYDAPVDEKGVPLYNSISRTVPVYLKENEKGYFRYGCDGQLAAVSTVDPFGKLTKKTIVDYLVSCENKEYGMINKKQNKGGAGLGLFQILSCSDLLVFNVRKDRKTEVIAFFNLDPKSVDKDKRPSLHFFGE